jgi:chromosome segregation ATPase
MKMTSAADRFAELETRILRTIELVKTTRQEKDRAEMELSAARSTIARLEKELEGLRHERDVVKNKVESLLESLAEITEETVV